VILWDILHQIVERIYQQKIEMVLVHTGLITMRFNPMRVENQTDINAKKFAALEPSHFLFSYVREFLIRYPYEVNKNVLSNDSTGSGLPVRRPETRRSRIRMPAGDSESQNPADFFVTSLPHQKYLKYLKNINILRCTHLRSYI